MEIIILIGMANAALTEVVKWLSAKLGVEKSRWVIHAVVLVLSVGWVLLRQYNLLTTEAVQQIMQIVIASVGAYEFVIKNLKKMLSSTNNLGE